MSKSLFEQIKDAQYLDTASGDDLSLLGQNHSIPRPRFNYADDGLYRRIVSTLNTSTKTVLGVLEDLLFAFLGTKANGKWEVYQIIPNQITVVLPKSTLIGNLASATYHRRELTPTSTTLTATASSNASSLAISSSTGFPASGIAVLDSGPSREEVSYGSIGAGPVLNLVRNTRKYHHAGSSVTYLEAEPESSSYRGDYFVGSRVVGELDGTVSPGDTSADLNSGHTFTQDGFYVFSPGAVTEERFYLQLSGNTLSFGPSLEPAVFGTQFANSHASGSSVVFYDMLASTTEPSSETVNGDAPILLTGETLEQHIIQYMELIKAAGIELRIVRYG